MPLPFASFGKSRNCKFWGTDKLCGLKSIRIPPGIHFWGLKLSIKQFMGLKINIYNFAYFLLYFPFLPKVHEAPCSDSHWQKLRNCTNLDFPNGDRYTECSNYYQDDNSFLQDSTSRLFGLGGILTEKWGFERHMFNTNCLYNGDKSWTSQLLSVWHPVLTDSNSRLCSFNLVIDFIFCCY